MTTGVAGIIEGEIVFHKISTPFSGATAYIFLEDVSRADAPSIEIARVVLPGITRDSVHLSPIPFRIVHPPLKNHARYTINVLIDIDGDGKISLGDYITMESYPVSYHHQYPLKVYVQQVK